MSTEGNRDPGKDVIGAINHQTDYALMFMNMWHSPKPVIAQVQGWCVGGGSDLALCADLIIVSDDT